MDRDWFAPLDHYCERLGSGFWAEPLNAVSNGAFLIAAALALALWRKAGARDVPALLFIVLTAIIGIGSFLFHTLANRWTLLADVLPITAFIYGYFFLALRRFGGLDLPVAAAATLGFFVFNAGFGALWGRLTDITLNGSVGYLPAALALVAVGAFVRSRTPDAARRLWLAAGLFAVSLAFRSLDNAVCAAFPAGTHALWHALNAAVLFVLLHAALAHGDRRVTPSP